jgi:2-polyprenyl-6-methoxyphenol hydroxylase-like FAD-dependent oxidoreductase
MSKPICNRAVVLGGSIAGTLAARVLSESFNEVVVVDRDEVLGVDQPRRGAPHTGHAHGLHARGYLNLEELFPNLLEELRGMGVPVGDLGEMRWYFNARLLQPARTGLWSITAPRPVLENYLRNRVAAIPNITYRQRTDMLGLLSTPDHSRVTGVRLQERAENAAEYHLEADLIVDATGRGSRTPVWLEQMGYDRPAEDRMKIGLAYTTRMYRTRPEMFDGVQSINPVASPAFPRGAFFGQVAADECILSLTGILGDQPPTDPDRFLEFVRSLPVPDVYDAVRDAEPTTDPVSFTFPASVRRRYERLSRFPDRLLVLGDAVCSFNPVYGQGMTVASMEVMALRAHLRRQPIPDSRAFLRDVGKIINNPWDISTSGDLDFPEVEGARPLKVRMGNAYMGKLQYAATKDASITDAFMRVAGLVDPPTALMRPRLIAKVLWHSRNQPPLAAPAPSTAPVTVEAAAPEAVAAEPVAMEPVTAPVAAEPIAAPVAAEPVAAEPITPGAVTAEAEKTAVGA